MKRFCVAVLVLEMALSFGSAFGQTGPTDDELRKLAIGSVVIRTEGLVTITADEVLSRVQSRVGDLYDPERAKEDAERITELAGIGSVRHVPRVVDNKVELTFIVLERDIVRLIGFVSRRKLSFKRETLRRQVGLQIGEHMDELRSPEAGRSALKQFYLSKGFAFIEVTLDEEQLRRGALVYTIDEGPKVRIGQVKLRGNKSIKSKGLKKVMKTRKKKRLFWPKDYTKEIVVGDVAKLQEVYYGRGFLDARVVAEKEFYAKRRKVRLTFVIEEGPVYTVEKIDFKFIDAEGQPGAKGSQDEKELRKGLKLEQGAVYIERIVESDRRRLLKSYREKGFIDVTVEARREFVAKDKVSVEFEITEAEQFRIGRIDISGNEGAQDKVFRQVLDEYGFQPGEWYNADLARGDSSGYLEKVLRRTTYVESATIVPSGEQPGQRDAQVQVIEGRTGQIMLGGGVGSDSGAFGQFVYEQRNFDIRNRPKSFKDLITGKGFKGAGQTLRIELRPGTEVSEYSISFTEPYLRNRPISLDVIALSREWQREAYDENRTRGYVGFEKRYRSKWRRSISFRVENTDVDSIDFDAPREIRSNKGGNLLGGVRIGFGRDLRDDKFNPTSGRHYDASYEQVGGDHTFGVLRGTYRWYKTLREDLAERKTVLAAKLHAGGIVGDAPVFEKFYAGGSRSLRGFEYRGVSTRGLQTNVPNPKRKDPIGSNWIFLANAEVSVPLVGENLAALFFVDSGAIDSGNYRAAVGTGIEIMIPQWFGPVPMRFELGVPVLKDAEDDTQVFSFSVGRLF